jgi:hypothetical protein
MSFKGPIIYGIKLVVKVLVNILEPYNWNHSLVSPLGRYFLCLSNLKTGNSEVIVYVSMKILTTVSMIFF